MDVMSAISRSEAPKTKPPSVYADGGLKISGFLLTYVIQTLDGAHGTTTATTVTKTSARSAFAVAKRG